MALSTSLADRRAGAFGAGLGREIRSDAWFHLAVALYAAAAWLLAWRLGRSDLFHPFIYVGVFLSRAGWTIVLALAIWAIVRGIRRQPASPLAGLAESLRHLASRAGALPPRFAAGILLFASMAVFYGTFTSVKNMLPHIQDFGWDPLLADIDRAMHGGVDPGPLLMRVVPVPLRLAVDYVYAVVWGMLLIGVPVWAAISTRHAHLRFRFFATFLLSWTLLGSLMAGFFMSAGPVYFGHVAGDAARFGVFGTNTTGAAPEIQSFLWAQFTSGDVALGSGISAFPSMHLAAATTIALYLGAVSPALGLAGAAFVAIIQFGSVLLGWHYAIDGYVSITAAALFWWACGRLGPSAAAAAPAEGTR